MKPLYFFRIAGVFLLLITSSSFAQELNYVEKKITLTNDGWELKGDLILVKSKIKSPVVLMLNKANGDRKSYETLAKLLVQKNISSLRLDLRGHGESVNKGKFIPFDSLNNAKINLDESYTDIIAGHKYLLSINEVDTNKIGIIGASYSGEEMMISSRKFKIARSYIALSPGSFSDQSIAGIDSCNTSMLFIKSMDERSMQGFEKEVFAKSKKAQFLIVAGKIHATDILLSYPETCQLIADWLKNHFIN
jgi:hypothetical protein